LKPRSRVSAAKARSAAITGAGSAATAAPALVAEMRGGYARSRG
jgi:hypothetical protein